MTFDAKRYMDAAAAAVDLSIPDANRDGVAANLERLHGLARQILEFTLPRPAAGPAQDGTTVET